MEKADSCRRAAHEAVADVDPPQLYDLIETTLNEASMVPGVLTIESAVATTADERSVLDRDANRTRGHEPVSNGDSDRALETEPDADAAVDPDPDPNPDPEPNLGPDADAIATQAAGVQLIYEGLRLTRSLAHDEPWAADADSTGDSNAGDLEILAADILVARGFYLLARTDAAGKAVRTVQAFGRDQTRRTAVANGESPADSSGSELDSAAIDANLERDILELAVLTGTAAVGTSTSPRLLATVDAIADAVGTSFPPASECLTDLEPTLSEHSPEDYTTDRATSATDH
ncbi:hypothetical protein GS429_02350 [Natronorubrum sp. JWXQ-INN-674]|uniref:Uncharacterized protein n=1 Tax=Natronorubrum halalkaliphilum TaxID=2691917 RepID=A0A6B0VK53_9EURY|nr:hypothetical protein [Natronorubrum halalkaliphilum]MXV60929.1 hypothetical protein [Natronorubrum halalkaliphilum]